jgi:hypothetical protein
MMVFYIFLLLNATDFDELGDRGPGQAPESNCSLCLYLDAGSEPALDLIQGPS